MQNISSQKIIIATVILIVLFYSIFAIYSDIGKIGDIYKIIELAYMIPILSILIFSIFLRSLIQKLLLDSIGIKISIKESFFLFCSGLAMVITPGGSGQMIKSHFINQNYGVPISKSLPLVFVERFNDFLSITILIFTTLLFSYSLESLIVAMVSVIILSFCVTITRRKKLLENFISKLLRIKFLTRKIPQTPDFYDSLQTMFEKRVIFKTTTFTIVVTLLEGFAVYLGFQTFHINISYLKSIQIFYTSILLGIFSFVPGGVGVMEANFMNLLLQEKISMSIASSLIIFVRLTTIWFVTGIGFAIMYFVVSRKYRNKL